MKIDPRHLVNLLAIAHHGSFNRAAAARGLSQPALSNSIAQLEHRLGFAVLDRSRRGSEVNEYGKILLQSAQALEALLTQTAEQVRLKRLGVQGPLRIGATPSMSLKFMPDLMARLLAAGDAMQVTLTEALDDELMLALREGALDVVLAPASGKNLPQDLIEEPLFDDLFGIGTGARHPLTKRRSLSLSELRDYPWVLPGPGSAYRRHIDALFLTADVPWPSDAIISHSLPLVESMVTRTNRITVVTRLQCTMHNLWRLRFISLRGGGRRTLSIKWRRAGVPSPLMVRLMQLAHELGDTYHSSQRASASA